MLILSDGLISAVHGTLCSDEVNFSFISDLNDECESVAEYYSFLKLTFRTLCYEKFLIKD